MPRAISNVVPMNSPLGPSPLVEPDMVPSPVSMAGSEIGPMRPRNTSRWPWLGHPTVGSAASGAVPETVEGSNTSKLWAPPAWPSQLATSS